MTLFIFGILILIGGIVFQIISGKEIQANNRKKAQYIKELESPNLGSYVKESHRDKIAEIERDISSMKKASLIVRTACFAVTVLFIALSLISIVPTGYTGIKVTFGKVEDVTLSSGINFKMPWQNVVNMDNREQRSAFTLQAFSKDIQQVDIQGSINVNIDKTTAMNLYKDVGIEYPNILIGPRVQEDVKIVIAQYTADTLIENRQKCSDAIYDLLKKELAKKGINVISFAIENIDFTDAFESAVEAKQVATQEKLKAQTEQERQTMEMQQKAERDRIQAQAAADVQKIEADAKAYAVKVEADAQAEANRKIAETLSEPLIQYNLVQQWNGKLPTVQAGEGISGILDFRSLGTEE